MKNTKNKALAVALGLGLGIVGANADESNADSDAVAEHFKKNYSYNAQVGAQYTQGYYDSASGTSNGKNNFQSLYAYLGFEGVEFERLRFGLNLMGSVKLGKSRAIYDTDMRANAILYQGFIGYTSEYFDLSGGREELDLEWVNDYVEGARFAVKIPQGATEIKGYWFYRQAVADNNEISQFEDGKIGHTFIVGVENNAWQPLAIQAYFVNVDSATRYPAEGEEGLPSFNGAWVGANLNFGNDLVASSTSLKYAYLHSKLANWLDAHFLQVDESLDFAVADEHQISARLGIMKVFNKKSDSGEVVPLNALGDQRPLDKGDGYLYNANALTAYVGLGYSFADYLEVGLIYGNTSGINGNINGGAGKIQPINAIELNITGSYAGAELGISYTKLLGSTPLEGIDTNRSKLNQDYFEAYLAYNF